MLLVKSLSILKTQGKFIQRENACQRMVNNDTTEDLSENHGKETFQYQLPRVRASFTLKVAQDSTRASLREAKVDSTLPSNETNCSQEKCGLYPTSCHPPSDDLRMPDIDNVRRNRPVTVIRPCVPDQRLVNNIPKTCKSTSANRSNHNTTIDKDGDKDFEIPLEESLKAVEDFIRIEKDLSKWNIGEEVLAKWKGNGLFYKAKIMDIFTSGMVVVQFDSYDVTDEIDYKDLSKFFEKTSNFKRKGCLQDNILKNDAVEKSNICAKKTIIRRKQNRVAQKRFPLISVSK